MTRSVFRRGLSAAVFLWLVALAAGPARAQVRIQAEAVLGEPFGVGRLLVDMPPGAEPDVPGPAGLGVSEKTGRVFYPAVDQRPFRLLVRDLAGLGGGRTAVYFLFTGAGPLNLAVKARAVHEARVAPRNDPRAWERMLGAWWQAYAPGPRLLEDEAECPPLVERYLQAMLARRLPLPAPARAERGTWQEQLGQDLGVFLGFEEVRLAMQDGRMAGRAAGLAERADQALPAPIAPPPLVLPPLPEEIDVEPLAARVPEECLYIRFGNVGNFLWFRGQLERASGDFGNLVSARGLDFEVVRRTEDQLSLRQSALSKALGGTVSGLLGGTAVSDVALVGLDLFQREGAAVGVLFHARSSALLSAEILRQRSEAIKSGGGKVKEETVEIEGRRVPLVSSADGRVRSFYAADGDFHLVTTSKALVRRFLQTGSGQGTLAAAGDFRLARSKFPAGRGDAAFVYLSDAFFRNVTGPHYRVEMGRRLEALVDVTLVELAVPAAAAEGKPAGSIEQLVAGGFLPREFGPRPDGSRAVYEGGEARDSLRGARGSFLPVPDVELAAVTPSEARMYARFAEHYRAEWGRLDPVLAAVRRESAGAGRERVTIDARVGPLSSQTYGVLSRLLGPADKLRLAPVEGDVAFGEAVLQNQRLFAGLRDVDPPELRIGRGKLVVAAAPPAAQLLFGPLQVGYLGTHGGPGILNLLSVMVPARADAAGYAGLPGGLWRRQWDRFTAFSFQPEVLAAVTPRLRFEETAETAHVRVRASDLTRTRLAPWLNGLAYGRARETSLGNLRLLGALEQQMHVPGEECLGAAGLLLDARLTCPLGGQYAYRENSAGVKRWVSTALEMGAGRVRPAGSVPDGFLAPPWDWFRGLDLTAELNPREAKVHAEVLMETPGGK